MSDAKPKPSDPRRPWPVRITMDGTEYDLDRTAAVPISGLAALVDRKAAKGWRMLCLSDAVDYAPGQLSVFWLRPAGAADRE